MGLKSRMKRLNNAQADSLVPVIATAMLLNNRRHELWLKRRAQRKARRTTLMPIAMAAALSV